MPSPKVNPEQQPSLAPRRDCQNCATRSVCVLSQSGAVTASLLAQAIQEKGFRKSEVIQIQGEASRTIAVVKLGTVLGTRQGSEGTEVPVALFGRGRVLGGYAMLGQCNPLGVQALSAGRLCSVEIAELYRMGATDRNFLDGVYANINECVGHLADWTAIMHVKGIHRQLLLALRLIAQEQGSRSIRLPSQVALAALLSTTRESIARALLLLEQKEEIIRVDRSHCEITALPTSALG
jgi:CRP/FNR family transcriptional regulator, cyclic AMP receptor protein